MNPVIDGVGPAHAEATRHLQGELLRFKRSLHLIRTGTDLHRSVIASGVPILGVLRRIGPIRTTALAAELCLDPSTVSRQVDGLVRTGHVEKVRDPDDGRATQVRLTEAGVAELDRHIEMLDRALAGLLDGWSTDDLTHLTTLLGRLNDDVLARLTPQRHEETQ